MNIADQNIRRVFEESLCARDIAQLLRSFDAETPLDRAASVLRSSHCTVAAVRTAGVVSGYLQIDRLVGNCCGDSQQSFAPGQVVCDALPLAQLVARLHQNSHCFVLAWGQVGGFVERSDLQKPPARMWLFGMVTLIESRFTRLIETHCTEDEWRACVSPGRVQKAETLCTERMRAGQQVRLIDCLQFADKTQVVGRLEKLRGLTRFQSRTQIEEIGRKVEKLRNNLAHSQDIIAGDWETIVTLAENLASILDGPPGLRGT
ncbi:MAG TPA: hypothetical protein VL096_13470 [Pirellulaceae bacterium]|nr:hypothetical protein [Pirellulaceae bacterium]